MNKLRQSLRRKKQPYVPEASRPHQWQSDEESVRKGKCSFPVRYLGHMEVEESRGMHVCEEAVKKLKTVGKKTVKAILWVSADGLRVVDDKTKDLIVDQTIEKVSFCAPDRNYDKAFSYICRDGTTRRWICHCFMALKDSGERLSHAVGCAFAACLERKQRREKECGVTASFDASRTSFTREGSFRLTASQPVDREESAKHPHDKKKAETSADGSPAAGPAVPAPGSASPPRGEGSPVDRSEPGGQHAIPRRHAPLEQLVRQGSFRGFPALSQKNSPFKRQLSLRLNELPSTLQRKTAEFEVKSPVPEFDASPTGEPGLLRPHADPFTTAPPTGSATTTTIPTLPPPQPAHGSGGWAEVPAAGVTTFHPSHRRTPSEAERWLQEAAKAAQTHQPGLPAPSPSPSPQPTHAHSLTTHPLLPAHAHTPSFPLLADTAPSSLFGPSAAYLPTYPPTGLSNGLSFPPARVPIVGITPSQMVVNAFSSAHPHPSHSPHLPPAFGLPSSPALSLPHPSPLPIPPPPRSNGPAPGATAARGSLPPPHPPDNDHFEAQWAALESKGQRAASMQSNPFNTDLHKTFEIQL